MERLEYRTDGGVGVSCAVEEIAYERASAPIVGALDSRRGALFSSSVEVPGRYSRWDIGFVDPPLVVTGRGRDFSVEALNARGKVLLPGIAQALSALEFVEMGEAGDENIAGRVAAPKVVEDERNRTRQSSLFGVVRALVAHFASPDDAHLGLAGAFGYDLVYQLEPMALHLPREADQRDLVLYLPDRLLIVDHATRTATIRSYEFATQAGSTEGLSHETADSPFRPAGPDADGEVRSDHAEGEYEALVDAARERFARGELFEVVLGQTFSRATSRQPGELFQRLCELNPSPYGALINLGEGEFLVAASPEMFVRVGGQKPYRRVETCPISGTIARGVDALADAEQVRILLNSEKDEAELTMCTDVDRNDKSRVCVPGSVRVIGRRQLEFYSKLIHTVDHVEGVLREDCDALDAFLSHAWAVTVTGAPKRWAIEHIEQVEKSARRWYGGAIGMIGFDGSMNTGLTLRTLRLHDGMAEVRAGATLLFDSDSAAEERETQLKASALLAVLDAPATKADDSARAAQPGKGRSVLLVDHEDSFVHTLSSYYEAEGAEVRVARPDIARRLLAEGLRPDLVVLSPGPGRPEQFDTKATLDLLIQSGIPVFGVCLGLQAVVEYFGGGLSQLPTPMHGRTSQIAIAGGMLADVLSKAVDVGRYHSLYADRASLPDCLKIGAETTDGVIMAIEHESLPIAAVQFHPESIMTGVDEAGRRIVAASLGLAARG